MNLRESTKGTGEPLRFGTGALSLVSVAGTLLLMIGVSSALAQASPPKTQRTDAEEAPRSSYANDTSAPLRNMVQVPLGQHKAQNAPTNSAGAPNTNSIGILISGVSADPELYQGSATQRVRIVNNGIQVFDKATGKSLMGPSDISTIWAGMGGALQTRGAGDPVVVYDQLADRWIISQFATLTDGAPVTEEYIAVSTTSDATGSYHRYAFHLGGNFLDYPHIGVRPDGYYMGDNVFNASGTERLGNQLFIFDRTAMLAGTPATFTSPGIMGGSESPSPARDGGPKLNVATLTINLTYDDAAILAAGFPPCGCRGHESRDHVRCFAVHEQLF